MKKGSCQFEAAGFSQAISTTPNACAVLILLLLEHSLPFNVSLLSAHFRSRAQMLVELVDVSCQY